MGLLEWIKTLFGVPSAIQLPQASYMVNYFWWWQLVMSGGEYPVPNEDSPLDGEHFQISPCFSLTKKAPPHITILST